MNLNPVITVKELSRLSGYSVSTVSKALNDKHDISVETKNAIKKISKKHNYIPNKSAVILRKKRTKSIALIIPRANNYFSKIIYNVEKIASENGYRILIFQSLGDFSKERKYIIDITDGSVDGALVVSENQRSITKMKVKGNLPILYMDIKQSKDSNYLETESINNFSKLLNYIN